MLHQNVPRKPEREMEDRSVGPLTKEHVPKLEELLEKYKSANTWDEVHEHRIYHGLCLSIKEHLGISIYYSDEFNSFIGNTKMYLCDAPQWYFERRSNFKFNEIKSICLQPRIETLEKIINYLNSNSK